MDTLFKERMADSELIVPIREKIQCYTCAYAGYRLNELAEIINFFSEICN